RPANLPEVASYGVYRLDNQDYVRIDGNYYRSAQNANGRYIYDGNPSHYLPIKRGNQGWEAAPPSIGRGGNPADNAVGSYNTTNNAKYPIRDANDRPLYITSISDQSNLSPSKQIYTKESIMDYINTSHLTANHADLPVDPKRASLYDKLIARKITANDVPAAEAGLVGQYGVFAHESIKKGDVIGVYSGKIVRNTDAKGNQFLLPMNQPQASAGDPARLLSMSGDNMTSRLNTNFEYKDGHWQQSRTGYNVEPASFNVTVKGYDPRNPNPSYRLVVLYATEDIPSGRELRWNYGYSAEKIASIMTP
ncbi:SET domain-containing protein, partial [Dyella sp.]|uniref:SET domain-containing protein n=1 Tax=Dyella sp. TaxID=1869338 RepID=UPI002ED55E22